MPERLLRKLLLAALLAASVPGLSAQPAPAPASTPAAPERAARPMAADPALEARVMAIAEELRCLVCQNETVAASHADLAVDLRKQIRQQLAQGKTPEQILDFMVARYGDFVLYRPPLQASTLLLWAGPFALLAFALGVLVRSVRRQRAAVRPPGLTPEQHLRARQLLGDGDAGPLQAGGGRP